MFSPLSVKDLLSRAAFRIFSLSLKFASFTTVCRGVDLFLLMLEGVSVPPGFEYLLPSQIREVLCYNFSNTPSATPSFLFFLDPNYSNIVLLYGITYLSNSPLVIQSFLSLVSQLLYSPSFGLIYHCFSFILAVSASIFYCISLTSFLIST